MVSNAIIGVIVVIVIIISIAWGCHISYRKQKEISKSPLASDIHETQKKANSCNEDCTEVDPEKAGKIPGSQDQ